VLAVLDERPGVFTTIRFVLFSEADLATYCSTHDTLTG
jgi:hypothetical protein